MRSSVLFLLIVGCTLGCTEEDAAQRPLDSGASTDGALPDMPAPDQSPPDAAMPLDQGIRAPDMATAEPDMLIEVDMATAEPDMLIEVDMAMAEPDMLIEVDMATAEPDMRIEVDMAMAEPDMAIADPDMAPLPRPLNCGDLPLVEAAFQPVESHVWTLTGETDPVNRSTGSCAGPGNDVAAAFEVEQVGWYTFATRHLGQTDFDTVLYARADCADPASELACNDDANRRVRGPSVIVVNREVLGPFAVFIDSAPDVNGRGDGGAWTLTAVRADENAAPVLEGGAATFNRSFIVEVAGRDINADVVGLRAHYMRGGEEGEEPLDHGYRFLPIGERTFSMVAEFRATDDPTVDGIRIRALDSQGHVSEPLDLRFADPPVLDMDAPCDRNRRIAVCPGEQFCAVRDGEQRCVSNQPPVIDQLIAVFNPDTRLLAVRFEGRDVDTNAWTMEADIFDAEGNRIGGARQSSDDIRLFRQRDGQYSGEYLSWPAEGVRPDTVRLVMYDSRNLASEAVTVDVTEIAAVEPYDGCDELGLFAVCPMGANCTPRDEQWICIPAGAPTLDAAQAVLNPDNGRWAFRLSGSDADRNVDRMRLQLLDAMGDPRPIEGLLQPITVAFDAVEWAEDDVTGHWTGTLMADGAIAQARVWFLDANGGLSDPLDVPIDAPREVEAGGLCDPNAGIERCVDGQVCGVEPDAEPRCVPAIVECPDGWAGLHLDEIPTADGWSVLGSTIGAMSHGEGSCGGGQGDVAHPFTAPEAGDYTFLVAAEGPPLNGNDPLIYARRFCGIDGPASELACNRSLQRGGRDAGILLSLAADETVTIFVDGTPWTGWQGDYRLTAQVHLPPVMEAAEVRLNRDNGHAWMHVEGQARPFAYIRYVLLDAEGDVLGSGEWAGGLPRDGAAFAGDIQLNRFAVDLPVEQVLLQVADLYGARSEPLVVDVVEPRPIPEGSECDFEGAELRCVDSVCASAFRGTWCIPDLSEGGVLNRPGRPGGEFDAVHLNLDAPARVTVATSNPDGSLPCGGLDTQLEIIGPNRAILASNNDAPGRGRCSQVQVQLGAGAHQIRIDGPNGRAVGAFHIAVDVER